jgi:hypothetical protein
MMKLLPPHPAAFLRGALASIAVSIPLTHAEQPTLPQSEVAGYWHAEVPDFRANAKRLQATPLTRADAPVLFAAKDESIAISIGPDGSVELKRDGKTVSKPGSMPWSVYHWTGGVSRGGRVDGHSGARYPLDNMKLLGANELLLWSSEGPFRVLVEITGQSRHLKFKLIHVSNAAKTGALTGDWQGHRVEFKLDTVAQSDAWELNTMLLNPMSELNTRGAMGEGSGITFKWPYSLFSQTDDRPQPPGMIGVYGFAGEEQFDDIMIDVWVDEPSLPRPHRAKHTQWTRKEVEAWLDKVVAFHSPPKKKLSFEPKGDPENLYKVADLAEKNGINQIGLHNWHWQGMTIGEPNHDLFPNGMSDVVKLRKYYEERGLGFSLHGFGAIFMRRDTKYGEPQLEKNLEQRGLALAARGIVVEDVTADQATFLLEPDLTLYPWMKPGMLPSYRPPPYGSVNSGYGNTFPPYFEGNKASIAFQGKVRPYSCELAEDKLWRITLDGWRGANKHSGLKKGEKINFIVQGSSGWMVPDPRSDMYVEMADEYSHILNQFKGGPVYDGAGWSEPLGTWGLRKMVQMVYERLEHPVKGHAHFGFTDQKFKRVGKAQGDRAGSMTVAMGDLASYTSSVDDAHYSMTISARSKDVGVRGNHKGIEMSYPENHGAWAELMDVLRIWTDVKPHLSDELKQRIANRYEKVRNTKKDIYVASETEDAWQLTRMRAMFREGIDGSWKLIAERPSVAPRQFLKADGQFIEGLGNPYVEQVPVMDLHVMASMTTGNPENLSLMPRSQDHLENLGNHPQNLRFEKGGLTLTLDNSNSSVEAYVNWKKDGQQLPRWLAQSVLGTRDVDMSQRRGIAITIEGDGSGSQVVFSYGASFPRCFVVDVDFVGKRTFEIPNGDMMNNRYDWDCFAAQSITSFGYGGVDRFYAYFKRVPAGRKASVRILDVRTMAEDQETGLIDPVFTLNDSRVKVQGTIPYNHYVRYPGGASAKVYNKDWFFVKDVPVTVEGEFVARKGANRFGVSAPKSPNTWVSTRTKVKDIENIITIQKP